jgi:hypothetical protein
MQVSGQLHSPTLNPGTHWIQAVGTLGKRKKSLAPVGNPTPAAQPAAIPTELMSVY